MSNPQEVMTLGPEEEAARLWEGAREAFEKSDSSLVSLCESLDLGIRAAEILLIQRLHPVRARFPATIEVQLELPDPTVDAYRDAMATPKAMQFTDLLDLLSEESLDCVSPRLHRGWEDRKFSCRRSRTTARDAAGMALDAESRDKLLLLSAYRNRIFRYPPPLQIVPADIVGAYPALVDLVDKLTG